MSGLYQSFVSWLRQPFSPGMSALQLFFGTGLVLIFVILWVFILERLEGVE